MAYKMYMDDVLIPITPKKVQMKINNQNKSLTLIGGEEINILKSAGLTDVTFDLLLPQVPYPFAASPEKAEYYLNKFEKLKTSKQPFQWILNRQIPIMGELSATTATIVGT